ncbi:MAG TPA: class I SAM-dependent methyltransferase [Bacillota bacterium]|nr:class I SAM-dependent methyltransferase [Bacillota bacterium]
MLIPTDWKDYELIDTGMGEKLERWGKVILRRPDPQIIWPATLSNAEWNKVDAHYHRSKTGGGSWEMKRSLPERWNVGYKGMNFIVRPTDFKHTGLFPEQAVNWDWFQTIIRRSERPLKVLNLFAYTGGATIAAARAGAEVCHIDAAKGMVNWARENATVSGLADHPIRYIVDDVIKFVEREKRRGRQYDGIIMDPPSYGHGPKGEVWHIEDALYGFVERCVDILAPSPSFFLINSYTTKFSPTVLANILKMTVGSRFEGQITGDEIGLPITASGLLLPCGVYGRWEKLP